MQRILFALLFVLLASPFAEARNRHETPFKGGDDDFFITAALGQTNHEIDGIGVLEQLDETDFSYGLNFDYRFAQYFSAGIGYVDFGKAEQFTETDTFGNDTETYTESTVGDGITASIMWHTDIKEGPWFFYIRVGRMDWDVGFEGDLTVTGDNNFSQSSSLITSGQDTFTGYGGAYYFTENVRVGLNFENYQMKYDLDPLDLNAGNYEQDFELTSLNVTYSF